MTTFTIVGYCTPNVWQFGEIMIEDKLPYCKKHGYSLIVYKECIGRPDGAMPHWCKFQAMLEAMDGNVRNGYVEGELGTDWVVWMDTDTIIMNDEVKLEDLLQQVMDEYKARESDPQEKHLIISYVGPQMTAGFSKDMWMNSGVFFVRNSVEGREMLRHADKQLQWKSHLLSDQMALSESCKRWPERTLRVRRSLFNAALFNYFPGMSYRKGSLLVHLNGVPKNQALQLMKDGKEGVLRSVSDNQLELIGTCFIVIILLVISGYTGMVSTSALGVTILIFIAIRNYFPTMY